MNLDKLNAALNSPAPTRAELETVLAEINEAWQSAIDKAEKANEVNRAAYEWGKYAVRTMNSQASKITGLCEIANERAARLLLAEAVAEAWSRSPTPDFLAAEIEAPMQAFIRSREAPVPLPALPVVTERPGSIIANLQETIAKQAAQLRLADQLADAVDVYHPGSNKSLRYLYEVLEGYRLASGQRQIVEAPAEALKPNPIKPISGPVIIDGMELHTT